MNRILLFLMCFTVLNLTAQDRYFDEIFEEVSIDTIVYSDVSGFEMDIYQPVGDEELERPVLIFAHGGAYFAGNKNTPTPTAICTSFAKRGYVAASIQYTLTGSAFDLIDSTLNAGIVMQTVADAKASIRYFRKDAATDNVYKINPNKIYVGGNSAGAITMMHTAYIDESEIENYPFLNDIMNEHGGIEGDKGNDGYPSIVSAVLNFAGGLNQLGFVSSDDPPVMSAHGDDDGIVPYGCDDVYEGDPLTGAFDLIDICGSGAMEPVLTENEIINELWTYEGADHTPWEGNSSMRTELIQRGADFLAPYVLEEPVSVDDLVSDKFVNVYPNPTANGWNIELQSGSATVKLFDNSGRVVYNAFVESNTWIDANLLPTGIYQLNIETDGYGLVSKRLVKQ